MSCTVIEPMTFRAPRPAGAAAGHPGRSARRAPARSATASAIPARPAGGMRLTARGRAVVVGLALAVAGVLGFSAQSAVAGAPGAPVAVETHTVRSGETLWQIATGVTAPGADVRDVIDDIMEINGMSGAGLQAGQQILIPEG